MARRSKDGRLTELESTVLGVIARDGPVSTYDVRKVFARSLTPRWSSSTGSIYPAIQRLIAFGAIEASDTLGTRGRQDLTVTEAGLIILRSWLTTLDDGVASATPDPIRTRVAFLGLLTKSEKTAFVNEALRTTETALLAAQAHVAERLGEEQRTAKLAALGLVIQLRGRREWLQILRDEFA